MALRKRSGYVIIVLICALVSIIVLTSCLKKEKIGVIFVVHGGMDTYKDQYLWDAGVQQFSYDPNHSVHKLVIWEPAWWSAVMQAESSVKFQRKYYFEYPRIGGTDPFHNISDQQFADMEAELDKKGCIYGLEFEVDWAGWMCGDCIEHYPYPRFMYYGPDGPDEGENCTYCGEDEPGGPWAGCEQDRYDVDGPVERLLKKGVSRIIMVDLTVGGVRFSKTYEVVQMAKRAIDDWNEENGTSFPYPLWINDYKNLMEESYPTEPEGWTRSLPEQPPTTDPKVPLDGSSNPIAEDRALAALQVEAIEAGMSDMVTDADTGILILNHALHDYNEFFDPKIDDTLVVNKNIKSRLLAQHPTMDPENIIGAYMGIKEVNPDAEHDDPERTREMRGESLGYAWLYESDKELPGEEWGYLYWDALEYLKNRGVKHIVIGFTQIVTDSVLNLVEIPNQIGKEIGFKTWAKHGTWDYETYPGVGHPFTDYWGNWVDTECDGETCCFTMGGCGSEGEYPPPRQTLIDEKRLDMDPSLAYDVSEYGHLGYAPAQGVPNPDAPVQDQYTGTWEMYRPPNDDPRVGKLLAEYVIKAARGKLK